MTWTADDFPLGARVHYVDNGNVSQETEDVVLARGVVNGPCMEEGDHFMVPVFTFRDHGREPTTIMVNHRNVVTVDPPTNA